MSAPSLALITLLFTAAACAPDADRNATDDTLYADTVSRDTSRLRDTASARRKPSPRDTMSRRDSLFLEQEMERIRNEPRRLPAPPPAEPPVRARA